MAQARPESWLVGIGGDEGASVLPLGGIDAIGVVEGRVTLALLALAVLAALGVFVLRSRRNGGSGGVAATSRPESGPGAADRERVASAAPANAEPAARAENATPAAHGRAVTDSGSIFAAKDGGPLKGRDFERIVEAVPNAVLLVDAKGRIALVNSQTEMSFGYSRDELLGRPVEMLVPERFRRAHPAQRDIYLMAPETRAMGAGRDLFGLRRDGREIPIEIGLNPMVTEHGPMVLASVIDITERLHAAQRIMNSLREKEVLLKEVHHRVKNNLAVIGSLFYLHSNTTHDEATKAILRDCQDRVRSMALVHERLYRSDDFSSINFAEYTEELAGQILRNSSLGSGSIRLTLDLEPVPLGIDQAIPCGLILTEVISNTCKHAFPDNRSGEVVVSLHRDGDTVTMSVADDGVGLPEEDVLQERRSLGMRLIRSLAGQLDAQVEFTNRKPGTLVRLTLEMSHVAPT